VPDYLPDSTDTVYLTASIDRYDLPTNSTLTPEVANLNCIGPLGAVPGLFIPVRATTSAAVGGSFYIGRNTAVSPPQVGSINLLSGSVVFRGSGLNDGEVLGTAIFNDNSINNTTGTITCGATFNDNSVRLDNNRIFGDVYCNTTGPVCTTVSAGPGTNCPTAGGALQAGLTSTAAAVAYTNLVPDFCKNPPEGWTSINGVFIKETAEVLDIGNAETNLWELKNNIGLFNDGTYRVKILCENGAWYAVPVQFGYKVVGYSAARSDGAPTFTHVLHESAFEDNVED
jgi:hypothetical protein